MSATATATTTAFQVLERGLRFPEGPRWHAGRLYYSDMYAGEVRALDLDGRAEVVARVPSHPSGLGWLPDGTMLVVSMQDRKLLRVKEGGAPTVFADLSALAPFHCNDLVVDARGHAYVGNFGSDIGAGAPPTATCLILVTPDGRAREVASDLMFPNGMVVTPDGRTLVVAETFGARLTAFDLAIDGSLSNRRVWADLGGAQPDGICLDAENAIWVAAPFSNELLRVGEGGQVHERIVMASRPIACALGGPDGRTLFALTSDDFEPDKTAARSAKIEIARVAVPASA
jgi:sugar lactone lactonase YvrE